jgi:hypothetical protein
MDQSQDQGLQLDLGDAARSGTGSLNGGRRKVSDEQLLSNLRAFVAPVAANAGAVTSDAEVLRLARDVSAVFADSPQPGGLTKAEVYAGVNLRRNSPCDRGLFEARFALFETLNLVQPYLAKKHQDRYVLNPAGLAGLLVVDRLGVHGGVDELVLLLDRTRWALERDMVDRAVVVENLTSCRRLLSVYAANLERLVETAPLHELMAEQRQHEHRDIEGQVHTLNKLVTDRFPTDRDLDDKAIVLIEAEQRYRRHLMAAVERVLDEGGNSLDFNVLSPEEYLTAAIEAPLDALAEVGRHIVVDPPMPWTDPGALIGAIDSYAPRRRIRRRPPEPPETDEPDPIGVLRRQYEAESKRRRLTAESALQGADEVELTSQLRMAGWPGAARILADLLVLHSAPEQPFAVDLGELLLIDPEAAVTYLHPVRLRRIDQSRAPGGTETAQASTTNSGVDTYEGEER